MAVSQILFLIICLFTWANFREFQRFKRTQDCTGQPGCALDTPSEIITEFQSELQCAIKCTSSSSCVNFNYWKSKSLCQLFNNFPYRLLATYSCSNYDMTPRIPKSNQADKNLALNQRACQSTTYMDKYPWFAVDGNVSLPLSSCAHTDEDDYGNNWFMLDLFEWIVISYVRILAREGNSFITIRYANLSIGVTNSSWMEKTPMWKSYPLCGVYTGPPVSAEWIQVNCTSTTPAARFVIVHLGRVYSFYGGYLCVCEFQVFGTF